MAQAFLGLTMLGLGRVVVGLARGRPSTTLSLARLGWTSPLFFNKITTLKKVYSFE